MTPVLVLCAVLGAAAAPDAPAPGALPIRRFALVAGVNDGGGARVQLRYARSDAEHVANVLQRLGGVAPADEILLLDPDEAALRAAFRDVAARVRTARATSRAELILYYSGHSDDEGFLLKGAHVPFQEVRRWLASVGAEVRIAIVDSCSSGALTRQKGGQPAPPFLVDTSSAVKGHAILTSSAADEASQESDRISASFFTYFLLTGLRGAADASGDGRVTVNEAYQFAFGETLARTERTRSGAQHPTYDIQLAGSGDVVLTDLRGIEAALVFPDRASGRFSVRDGDDRLVAELRKLAGRPIELGVEPGTYRVVRDEGGRLAEAQVKVAKGARVPVPIDELRMIERELATARGVDIVRVPVDISVFPPLSLNGQRATSNSLQLGLLGARTTRLRGFGLAPATWIDEGAVGAQVGGVWATAGGAMDGVQISGIVAAAGSMRGGQVGGIWGSAAGPMEGVQVSGIVGVAGSLSGLQLGGIASWTSGQAVGVQLSGVLNVVGGLEGAQLAVVNVARDLRGAQLGLVNVSEGPVVHGWQVGLVNVSRQVDDGIPLGLVNVVRDGWHRVLLVLDEDGSPTLGWAGGNGWFHTTLEASFRRGADGGHGWAALGPGVHLLHDRFGVDLDLLARHAVDDLEDPGAYVVLTLRALAKLPISSRVALVAGPTANVLLGDPASAPAGGGAFGDLALSGDARAWVGLQLGVAF